MAPKKKLPPELDPILPLPAGTGIPPVEEGQGKAIMQRTDTVIVVMPYRAFYFMWEHAERQAAKEYPKYVGTTMDHAAQTWLDAVHAFRNAAAGSDLRRYTEEKAQKARKILARVAKEAAAKKKTAKETSTTSVKGPSEAPREPAKPRKTKKQSREAGTRSAKPRRANKTAKKATGKKRRSTKRSSSN